MSPLSAEAQRLYRNAPALIFTDGAFHDVQRRTFERLGTTLGTYWTRESVAAMMQPDTPGEQRVPRQALAIPLLLGMMPKLQDFLRDSFGSTLGITPPEWYQQDQGEVVEGFNMPRDKFVQLASMFTPVIPRDYPGKH